MCCGAVSATRRGTVANVLSQLVLPFNMVGSLLFLKTRYRKVHYIGSILAVYGVVRVLQQSGGGGALMAPRRPPH